MGFWIYIAPVGTQNWEPTNDYVCRGAPTAGRRTPIEPVLTIEDFRRLPLPAATIEVQPPNRRTLINIPTNLYAGGAAVIIPTTVLGQAIRVRATPVAYQWHYGDGSSLRTKNAGAAYPDLSLAHTYRTPGTDQVALSTSYTGEYSVAGGPWQPIDGTATVPSPAATLTVLAAENHLVVGPTP